MKKDILRIVSICGFKQSVVRVLDVLSKSGKKAFTLAETLITIGIIGLVAALVIPTMVQDSKNKELVSKTIKNINTLSNAYKQADVIDNITKLGEADFKLALKKHIKLLGETCSDGYDLCLLDGSRIKYGTFTDGCSADNYTEGKSVFLKNTCMELTMDVNGGKGPNKGGRDIYRVYLTKNGVFTDGATDSCGEDETGLDCGAYVIANHKLWDGNLSNEIVNLGGGETGGGEEPAAEPEPEVSSFPENCSNSTCSSCTEGYSASTGCKCLAGYKLSGEECVEMTDEEKNTETLNTCLENSSSTCTISGYGELTGIPYYSKTLYVSSHRSSSRASDASSYCTRGTRLPNKSELLEICKHAGEGSIPSLGYYFSSDGSGGNLYAVEMSTCKVHYTKGNLNVLCVGK